jgi:hypothetical protein
VEELVHILTAGHQFGLGFALRRGTLSLIQGGVEPVSIVAVTLVSVQSHDQPSVRMIRCANCTVSTENKSVFSSEQVDGLFVEAIIDGIRSYT